MYFSEQFSPLGENVTREGKAQTWFANVHYSGPVTKGQFTISLGSNEQTLWNVFDVFIGYL